MTAPRPSPKTAHVIVRRDYPYIRWFKAGALILVIVIMCISSVRLASKKVRDFTPDELKGHLAQADLPMEQVVEQINRLDVDTRREVMQSPQAQKYFESLPKDKRFTFVRETMDRGIRNQIERYRKMNAEEKKAFVEEAKERQREVRERLKNQSPEEREKTREAMNSGNMTEVIERAIQNYLSVTSSEERAELAALYDGALENFNIAKGQ
jgi:hypothetical protein